MTDEIYLDQTLTFRLHTCGNCGITYAMEEGFRARKQADKTTFYCPNGHGRMFTGRSDAEKLKDAEKDLVWTQGRLTHERDQREAAERSRNAFKGQVTKIKRRVGKGVCPCCNRSFQDLGAHMETKHPGYGESETTE